ncbi:PREDICTED: monocarboxylate transporter 9-like [Priapulus caudatus]|uniref:Monocarboxylate transporter 9-like n=1 Tax=Priapulus caudatus TaxID=37621 RepID=A0ABM1DU11_PRICU|nr:PREDICTED: monocarboxylate transporter 9-like [Priapulus caudatus]
MSGVDLYKDALALRFLFGGLGSLVGPLIVGWLLDITGDTRLSFYFMGISCMLCVVILCGLLYWLTRKTDVQSIALVELQGDGESNISEQELVEAEHEWVDILDDPIITHM